MRAQFALLLAAGTAFAGDADPVAPQVEVRLAAPVDESLRYRVVLKSKLVDDHGSHEALETYEYLLTVKSAQPSGMTTGDVKYERLVVGFNSPTLGVWTECDSSKPAPLVVDAEAKATYAYVRAIASKSFRVTLDATGLPTAVSGLAAILNPAFDHLSGTSKKSKLTDAECLDFVRPLFFAAPLGAHAVGASWDGVGRESVSSLFVQSGLGDFTARWTLTAATADDVSFAANLACEASEHVGSIAAKFNHADGFVTTATKHVELSRTLPSGKEARTADYAIERLASTPPKSAGTSPPAKK